MDVGETDMANWKYTFVSEDEKDDAVVRAIELREREMFAYELNIEGYQHALETAENEFEREHWRRLLVTEAQQLSLSKGYYRAVVTHANKDPVRHEAAKVRVAAEKAALRAEQEAIRRLNIDAASKIR